MDIFHYDCLGVFVKFSNGAFRSLEAILANLADFHRSFVSAFPCGRATICVPSLKPLNPSLVPFTVAASVTLIVCSVPSAVFTTMVLVVLSTFLIVPRIMVTKSCDTQILTPASSKLQSIPIFSSPHSPFRLSFLVLCSGAKYIGL